MAAGASLTQAFLPGSCESGVTGPSSLPDSNFSAETGRRAPVGLAISGGSEEEAHLVLGSVESDGGVTFQGAQPLPQGEALVCRGTGGVQGPSAPTWGVQHVGG